MLSGVSFSLEFGGILLLRGQNGAGKSTLLRAISGLTPLAAGRITWAMEDVTQDFCTHAARIAWLGHLDAVKPALTAAEHVGREALVTVGLGGYADLPARLLSAGQKRRLALARVVSSGAKLWLLDEPTTGLDTASVARFCDLCEVHLAQGGMIIASTHMPLDISNIKTLNL